MPKLGGRSVSPSGVGGVSLVTAVGFCVVRLARLGGGAGTFVLAGSDWTDKAATPRGLPVLNGSGFDGQFYYRLALRPSAVGVAAIRGIRFDLPYRGGRVGYPFLAWLVSFGGHERLVPWALIAVNVVAMGALGWIGACLAVSRHRHALWGLAISFYWGFGIVLGRDLSELVAATAIFGAVYLIGQRRLGVAGLVLILAVLTREQSVLTVAALCIGGAIAQWRVARPVDAARAAAAIAVPPAAAFLAWQFWARRTTHKLPALSSSSVSVIAPFKGVAKSVGGWWRDFGSGVGSSLPLLCAIGLVVLVGAAIATGGVAPSWRERPWELLAGAAALIVLVCSSPFVLVAPADFRQSGEIAGFAWLVLWASPRRRTASWPLVVVAPLTVLTFAFRALVL
jgi:hypothetical protein